MEGCKRCMDGFGQVEFIVEKKRINIECIATLYSVHRPLKVDLR